MNNPLLKDLDFHFDADVWSLKALENIVTIHEAELCSTKDGWVFIHLLWKGPVESKYVREDGYMMSINDTTIHLEFSEIKSPINDGNYKSPDYKAHMEVGLNKRNGHLEFDYKFIENLKYGVNIYFCPKGALAWDKDLVVHDCTKKEEK